ncbi:MAG: hypothetical protein SCH39_12685 [Methanosarcinales archaeon]|nr:hypothetical protein [Methanosarcinales archaeon]
MTQINESTDKLVEEGIIELIDLFKKNPAQFEYEIDLCHLFHDILVKKLCNHNDLKIRWELKSIMTYDGKEPALDSKFFAKYDISLIQENSEVIPFAFEFKLFKDLQYDDINIPYFTPTRIKEPFDDLNKLTNPDNKVERGYILTFVYGKISISKTHRINRHKEKREKFQELIDIASKINNEIKIVCVHFSDIGEESPSFGILKYPDNFCEIFNQSEESS